MSEGEKTSKYSSNNLPADVQIFPFQVAGHKHGAGRLTLGVLKHKNGNILKPMFEGDKRAETELSFYKNIQQNCSSDPLLQVLSGFLPSFRGTWKTCIEGKEVNYMCLEDVCEHFQNPSVLDVKMGSRTYEIGATDAKKAEQMNKFLHGAALGIRITGMKIYNDEKHEYTTPDRINFRALSPISMVSALESYLTCYACVNVFILSGFIHKMIQLDEWFEKQRMYMFTASSLLFVYEGTISSWILWVQNNGLDSLCNFSDCIENSVCKQTCNKTGGLPCKKLVGTSEKDKCISCGLDKNICSRILSHCNLFHVSMIDFAHCVPFEEKDTNYIFGLHKLLDYLKNLLKSQLEKL